MSSFLGRARSMFLPKKPSTPTTASIDKGALALMRLLNKTEDALIEGLLLAGLLKGLETKERTAVANIAVVLAHSLDALASEGFEWCEVPQQSDASTEQSPPDVSRDRLVMEAKSSGGDVCSRMLKLLVAVQSLHDDLRALRADFPVRPSAPGDANREKRVELVAVWQHSEDVSRNVLEALQYHLASYVTI